MPALMRERMCCDDVGLKIAGGKILTHIDRRTGNGHKKKNVPTRTTPNRIAQDTQGTRMLLIEATTDDAAAAAAAAYTEHTHTLAQRNVLAFRCARL